MAKINRSDIIQKAVNDLAISIANDKVPTETLDKVQLTYSLNKKFSSWTSSGGSVSTGNASVPIPTPGDRSEVYLTSLSFSYIKDALCDIASGSINVAVTPFESGVASSMISLAGITLTAQQGECVINLSYPLKLKSGTSIISSVSYTAGTMVRRITAVGFTTSSN